MQSIRSFIIREMLRIFLKPQEDIKKSVEGQRKMLNMFGEILRLPENVNVINIDAGGVAAKWVYQKDADQKRVVIHLHGGAYDSGSANTHKSLAASISRFSKAWVLLPEYRLAPEYRFPSALSDSLSVYIWLINQGIAPSNIIISGDSAGGGLAISTIFALRNKNYPLPAGIVCISPWTDLSREGRSHITKAEEDPLFTEGDIKEAALNYTKEQNLKDPFISPVYGDFQGFPPLLIQVGDKELLLSDSIKMKEKAEATGAVVTLEVWEGMWHDWHMMGNLIPESRRAIKAIGEFACKCFDNISF